MTSSERRIGLVAPGRRAARRGAAGLADRRRARAPPRLRRRRSPGPTRPPSSTSSPPAPRAGPCDLSGVSHERLRREGGLQWPCPAQAVDEHAGTTRLYADKRFPTPDGRARFAPTPHVDPAETPDPDFPILLTTGRVADQWHTMTRTGHSPALLAAAGKPTLSVHPLDAAKARLEDGGHARRSSRAAAAARFAVSFDDTLPRGVAFAPFHWGALHADAGAGTLNALTIGAVDPTSAQPELKAVAVRLEPVTPARRAGRAGARRRRRSASSSSAPAWRGSRSSRRRCAAARPSSGRSSCSARSPARSTTASCSPSCSPAPPGPASSSCGRCRGTPSTASTCAAAAAPRRSTLDGALRRRRVRRAPPYDALVIATGSRAFVPPIPGADLPHVDVFRTWRDADALAATPPGTRAVVVGGGLLGPRGGGGAARPRRRP